MKKRHVIYLVVAFLCAIAVLVVLIDYLKNAISGWEFSTTVSQPHQDIIDSWVQAIIIRAIYCLLALSSIVLLALFGIGQRKQIINAIRNSKKLSKAEKMEKAKQKELLHKKQKMDKLEKQLQNLKKSDK